MPSSGAQCGLKVCVVAKRMELTQCNHGMLTAQGVLRRASGPRTDAALSSTCTSCLTTATPSPANLRTGGWLLGISAMGPGTSISACLLETPCPSSRAAANWSRGQGGEVCQSFVMRCPAGQDRGGQFVGETASRDLVGSHRGRECGGINVQRHVVLGKNDTPVT